MTLDILSIFAAIALRELAHVFAAVILGVKVKRFGLCWRGVYIVREAGADWQNLLISLAGPLANLALAATALFVFRRGAIFCAMNLVFALINLLPLPYRDGLRVCKLLWGMASSRLSSGPEAAAVAVIECPASDSVDSKSEQQERSQCSCGLSHKVALLASSCYILQSVAKPLRIAAICGVVCGVNYNGRPSELGGRSPWIELS
jgi:hypothetical protein